MQILDDGHITDAQGRKVDFKNTVLIMTSNAGAENIISPKRLGFASQTDEKADYAFMKERVMEEVKRLFKPEFLNRIDEILVFHPLSEANIREIAGIMLKNISGRTKKQLDITLQIEDSAVGYLAKKGYDAKYGARPLRRTIQTELEDRLSEALLEGRVLRGGRVTVSGEADGLRFSQGDEETGSVSAPEGTDDKVLAK